jgi:hypothetical protein
MYKCRLNKEHHLKWWVWRLFLLILDYLAIVLGIWTLQDKHNIWALSEKI